MFIFSNFQFIPNCQKLWYLKNQLFLLLRTACISLALPLSLLPFTRDTHLVGLQWNISQCVQIWIFNISKTDSFTITIYLWYKYYSKWICVSFAVSIVCKTTFNFFSILNESFVVYFHRKAQQGLFSTCVLHHITHGWA